MQTSNVKRAVRDFLETYPLYRRMSLSLPEEFGQMHPDVLELTCVKCRSRRPFRDPRPRGGGTGLPRATLTADVYGFRFRCTGCNLEGISFYVEIQPHEGWIRKVGQRPPWSIDVAPELEEFLGDEAELLKKATVCMSQSYGIGACAYMRRLLENRISPLLHEIRRARLHENASEDELARIDSVAAGKAFDSKLSLAAEVLPGSLIVDGVNPMKLIHDHLSVGLHQLSEDEALEAAMEIKAALEYVLTELGRHEATRNAFVNQIKDVAKRRTSRQDR